MTTQSSLGENHSLSPREIILHRIRFVPDARPDQRIMLTFKDPAPCTAACVFSGLEAKSPEIDAGDGIDILIAAGPPAEQPSGSDGILHWAAESASPGAAPPIVITIHGAQIIWTPTRAAILALPDRTEPFLLALVDFCYYENELKKLEREIGECWPLLGADTSLTHTVQPRDADRFESMGQRLEQTLLRRMRLVRIEPHLNQPRPYLPPLANQLMDRLRDKSHVEDRLEALDAQLEVFERVYELSNARINEFKSARQERTLEWIIIVLLTAEAMLLLIDLLWTMGK